ncbi:hypothetical protein ACFC00_35850 [Streptomyces adustus]|uniref:hypothetical protein n=1 Tax=Streptomyces adustus TaxID=1609272 RepID=UPI0035D81FE2
MSARGSSGRYRGEGTPTGGRADHTHGFDWEVEAVRADVEEIDVEVGRSTLLPTDAADRKLPGRRDFRNTP